MFGLIVVGGFITYMLNRGAGMISLGSVVAFGVALVVDAVLYELFYSKSKLVKMNISNTGSALADSVLFPTIAFGVFIPWVVLGQFLAKTLGGAFWAWILTRRKYGLQT
jgi:uncharacterized PurR-regulated membrane protein YhhQ (DUF165 family)